MSHICQYFFDNLSGQFHQILNFRYTFITKVLQEHFKDKIFNSIPRKLMKFKFVIYQYCNHNIQ